MGCRKKEWQSIAGDEEAKELVVMLYKRGHNLADYLVEQILKEQIGRDEREDIIHNGFVRLIRNVETLKTLCLEEQINYMCKAVRSAAYDEARKISQKKKLSTVNEKEISESCGAGPTPEDTYIKKEKAIRTSHDLQQALLRLTPRDCELLVEKYRDRRSDREIGERLGIKTEYVRVYIARARKRLAEFYTEEAAREEPIPEEKAASAGR